MVTFGGDLYDLGGDVYWKRGADHSQFDPHYGKAVIMRHIPGGCNPILPEPGEQTGI